MYALLSIFSVVFVILNVTSAQTDSPIYEICDSKDIRNDVVSLNELRGCRVIVGSLTIALIEKYNETDYDGMELPELTEVTEFVLLYRVNGLKSLGKLFPNLRIVRGNKLIHHYAFVIYETPNLREIGLKSLLKIERGSVRIANNPSLCFVETIDWSRITSENDGNVFRNNKPVNECPSCPTGMSVAMSKRSGMNSTPTICPEIAVNKGLCWNQNECQHLCPLECGNLTCNANGECCDESCIGCSVNDTTECLSCRYMSIGKGYTRQCVQKCTPNTYAFENNRCVTEEECYRTERPVNYLHVLHGALLPRRPYIARDDGVCSYECPNNYYAEGPSGNRQCKNCGKNGCKRDCPAVFVDSISTAEFVRDCTHIKGDFLVSIENHNGHANIEQELEKYLGDIEVIDGFLSIFRSPSLTSLGFFKKLRIVRGVHVYRDFGQFSLRVFDNPNLQALFPSDVIIERGRILFHFNPKLCMKVIEDFKKNVVDLRDVEKLPVNEVAPNSNGDRTACDVEPLTVSITKISYNVAILEMKPLRFDDESELLGYILYYKPAPFENVSIFDDRDVYGDDAWTLEDIEHNNRQSTFVTHILTQLKPSTQYAYYVQTYTVAGVQRGGLSEIQYFTTLPRPSRSEYTILPSTPSPEELKATKERMETFAFEDALHNTVYVRKSSISYNDNEDEDDDDDAN